MMIRIIILTVFIWIAFTNNNTCALQCLTCEKYNNPYSCLSCAPNNQYIYIFSCPSKSKNITPFVIVAAIITVLHIFMLAMGIGIYRDVFQNIQLATLVTWRYDFQQGIIGLQGTNLAMVQNNSFPDTFGGQFIVVMIILGVYWLILIGFYKSKNNTTAILLKRKVIILPVRIITFIFNITLYASLIQVTTIKTQQKMKVFALILAIFALIKITVVLIGLAVTCNWRRFEVSDPHYYVLIEQITTKKWYAKNNVLFSLMARGIIIISFILLFQEPLNAGILMLIFQLAYTLYIMIFIRYQNIRYFVTILFGNIFMFSILLVIYLGNVYTIGTQQWSALSMAYIILLIILVVLFFVATMLELIIKRDIIAKQIKSFYKRFIKCQKSQDQVLINKYDENSHRQKITQFHSNSLYNKQLHQNNVELINGNNKSFQ